MKLSFFNLFLLICLTQAVLAASINCLAVIAKKSQSHRIPIHSLSTPPPVQDEAILAWCAAPMRYNNNLSGNNLHNMTVPSSTELWIKVDRAVTVKSTTANQEAAIGDLESIIKLIKQQQESTINLKSVGDSIIAVRPEITNNPHDPANRQKLGVFLYLAGDYEGAASEFRHVIALAPSSYVAYALLGQSLADIGEHEASTIEFRRAIALAPTVAANHYLYAENLLGRGDISEGINEYRRAIGIKPTANAWIGLAQSLIWAQDIDGAVKAARQAVSEEPNSAQAHVILTKALLLAGDLQASARTAREALLLNPNSALSHIAAGRSLFATGKITEATEEFNQAVSLDPLSAEARNDLGYILYKRGDIINAINEFRLALRLNPHLNEARNNLEIAIYGMAKHSSNNFK